MALASGSEDDWAKIRQFFAAVYVMNRQIYNVKFQANRLLISGTDFQAKIRQIGQVLNVKISKVLER